jgi:hypothetical protein
MRALYAPAAIVMSFVLALLLFSCSAGQSERETGEDRANEEGRARVEPEARRRLRRTIARVFGPP